MRSERRPTVRRWVITGIGSIVIAVAARSVIALANSDSEGGITGRQADRAIHAALEATGGGTVNAVERDSENGAYWEVEVSTPDGRVVDVRLSWDYSVVVIEGDSEATDTGDAAS
jgi:hypothetical protein